MTAEIYANGQRRAYGTRSGDDECLSVKDIGLPEKQTVRASVPYCNGSYDFSLLDGEAFYDDRHLTYTFGIVGSEAEVLAEVSGLATWLYGIHDMDIHDSEIPYWHFHGSCDKVTATYDETGMSADVKATFSAYPYLIANSASTFELSEGSNMVRNQGRRIRLMAMDAAPSKLTVAGRSQSVEGTAWLDLWLEPGGNEVVLEGGPCTLCWVEERL